MNKFRKKKDFNCEYAIKVINQAEERRKRRESKLPELTKNVADLTWTLTQIVKEK